MVDQEIKVEGLPRWTTKLKDQEKFEEDVPNRDGWARGRRLPLKDQQKYEEARPNEGGKARDEDGELHSQMI